MTQRNQYCIEEKKNEENREFPEAHDRMPDGKLITLMQICLNCGRKYPFKRGRRSCPHCQSLLRTRTMVLTIP